METNVKIVFSAPGVVEVQREEVDLSALPGGQVWVKNLFSMVSPGTELACLAGKNSAWFSMPKSPGYAAVGEVVAVGAGVEGLRVGERVFHNGPHMGWSRMNADEALPVPEGVDGKLVPSTQLANIAMASTTVSNMQVGDHVAVVGQGMIGNLASQLARLQGAIVHDIDVSDSRLEVSRACGSRYTLSPKRCALKAELAAATGGSGVTTLIDATGSSRVIVESVPLVAPMGEIILLGTPRDEYQCDVTSVFGACHRQGITIKGAHVGHAPRRKTANLKHSSERKSRIILDLIHDGKLQIAPLISHVLKPSEAPQIYGELAKGNERVLGVVFDWA